MRRREFIGGLAGAAAWPGVGRTQQRALPTVGFLNPTEFLPGNPYMEAFHRGLAETGFIEGRNLTIEYRTGSSDPLTKSAADLVQRRVAVIATPGSTQSAIAAKGATATIPIVFGIASDPIQTGLVASLSRPGGNATGFSEMNTEVGPKRFELLRRLMPRALRFGVLVNPNAPATAELAVKDARAAAAAFGVQIEILSGANDSEIRGVLAELRNMRIDALLFTPDPVFDLFLRTELGKLPPPYPAVPVMLWSRTIVEAGGLMSYGSNVVDMFHQVGIYVGRVLKGEKPTELPVLQPTKFDLVINLKTAKALGLTIPETLLATADEVIQ